MAVAVIKRMFNGPLAVILLFGLLLGSLYLMSSATQNSEQFGESYIALLLINVLELVILAGLIGINLGRLVRQYRNHATGSRLATRLVIIFVVLAVVPASILYYFSMNFIHRGIDSWFDVKIEKALDDALNLSRAALDWRMRDMLRQTEVIADAVSEMPQALLPVRLEDLRQRSGAAEVSVMTEDGRVLAFDNQDATLLVPTELNAVILSQLRQGVTYVALDPGINPQQGLFTRVAVNVPQRSGMPAARIVHALFMVPDRVDVLANSVQQAYSQYERLVYLRGPLKFSFMLTLSLILILSLFTAIWAAFYAARRLVAPIRILAIGTRAVTSGDYNRRLPIKSLANDELGFLVKSFNTMMAKIASAQEQAQRSQRDVESQRAYLETVLKHLSSGVLTFGSDGVLRTANSASEHILGVKLDEQIGCEFEEIGRAHEHLQKLVELLKAHGGKNNEVWQEQMVLFGPEGRQVLMCRGVVLPETTQESGGVVVVFDDITNLIQAQRDAAWGEVARRLAHEIKNPLTPIQLSAERLRHKYLPMMSGDDADVLNRATNTIVQQVESMKMMVKEFSEYARSPKLILAPVAINDLVNDVLELYRIEGSGLQVRAVMDPALVMIEADAGRLRQLLHNLIKNAIEAMAGQSRQRLEVHTILQRTPELQAVELIIEDNGPGVPPEMIDKLFEPYVSTKPKGSGLGLAIVKKIVEEHNGVIWVEQGANGGARFVIRLPLQQVPRMDDGEAKQRAVQ